ncbi:BRCA1-associated RING domain protein 1-like [Penaeus japonicus]|uniref:BRCA1-associated RING domain protein 1-like n=1 Tax=Penaeus japonicus TaxID=27405 RepID=UPI001C71361F|nr:BRCA1-associated RING domain protein 1-like [Penaeus japonicus]
MDVLKLFDWEQSREAIKQLEKLLECNICGKVSVNPQSLGRCDHFFCSACVGNIENGICPVCKIPSPPCEMKPDRIIAGLVSSAKDLELLLDGGELNGITPGLEAPPTPPTKPSESIRTLNNPDKASDAKSKIGNGINKKKNSELRNDNSKVTDNQQKVRKKAAEVKPVKKAKTSLTHNTSKSGSSSKNSPPSPPGQKSDVKVEKNMKPVPITPDSKKIMKLPDLSALGMSPSTPAINKRNSKGETPLHVACIKGDAVKVQSLLSEGANPNTKDNAGWTPLHEACSHGFLDIAKTLLQHGAIVDVPGGNNEIPLHDAVTQGMVEVIKLLRSWGASDTARNLHGHTPRSLASVCNGAEELLCALDTHEDESLKRPVLQLPLQEKVVLLGYGLSSTLAKKVERLSKLLRARIVTDFSSDVTHVIAECAQDKAVCQRTLKYMMAVASGKWILSHRWMEDCVSQELALNPEEYEVSGSTHNANTKAPKQARTNAAKMRPGLFNGCHVFLWGNFREPNPSKKEMEGLIKAGGGVILAREPNPESIPDKEQTVPYHSDPNGPLATCSHYIIYQEGSVEPQLKYDMAHIKSLPLSWLIDCVDHFQLVPPYK